MPPKKNTIEKELKKKNKETAENLVKMLEQNVEAVDSSVNYSGTNADIPVRAGSARVAKRVENPLKGAKHAVASTSKKASAFEKDKPDSKRSAEKEKSVSKRSTQKDKPYSKRSIEKDKLVLKRPLDDDDSSSKRSKNEEPSNVGNTIAKENSADARNSKAAKTFRYEIDCTRVKDSVDVKDLQQYVRVQLKVNGEKNNLEGNLTVSVDGWP